MNTSRIQFVREFDFENGTCDVRDSTGKIFFTIRLDALNEHIARQLCLQQFARVVIDRAIAQMRLGLTEEDAKEMVIRTYDKIVSGRYKPRELKSPPGVRQRERGVDALAQAALDAGYRSVTHGNSTYEFRTKEEAVMAFRWLRKQPADMSGISGRQVYGAISNDPQIVSRINRESALAKRALGKAPPRPLPSPS